MRKKENSSLPEFLTKKPIGFYDYTVLFTCLILFLGTAGIFFAVSSAPVVGLIFLMICGLLDMFDGKLASTKERTMVEKRYGLRVDTLSDMVAFGLLPVAIGYGCGLTHPVVILLMSLYAVAVEIRLSFINLAQETCLQQGNLQFRSHEGLPVKHISLILPAVYLLRGVVGNSAFSWIYLIVLLLAIPAYLLRFLVPKLRFRGSMVLLGIGLVEMVLLMVLDVK